MVFSDELWCEVHGDLDKSPFVLFLIDDELSTIDDTVNKSPNDDLKALKRLRDALLQEHFKNRSLTVVLLDLPMEEESFDQFGAVKEDHKWNAFCKLLSAVGPRGILICDVMYYGDTKNFYDHVARTAPQYGISTDNIAPLTKNPRFSGPNSFQKLDLCVVNKVLAWVKSRITLYHRCYPISRLIYEYVRYNPVGWTHNSLTRYKGNISFGGVDIKGDETIKALFMVNDKTCGMYISEWEKECLKIEYFTRIEALRELVYALDFPCEVNWPNAVNHAHWLLPCMPGLVFLFSLRAFIERLIEQQPNESNIAPGPPTKIEFFQSELDDGLVHRAGLTLSLSTRCSLNSAVDLVDVMNERYAKKGTPVFGRGASGALFSLLFCHVDGVELEILKQEAREPWLEIFTATQSSMVFAQPAKILSCSAEGSELTLFWTAMKTSGGIPPKSVVYSR